VPPVIVYLDTKHRGLEACSGRAVLAIENCKDCIRGEQKNRKTN
jgi:hypothetical protein